MPQPDGPCFRVVVAGAMGRWAVDLRVRVPVDQF